MKVILLIDANSIYCKEYIENVLLGKYEVIVLSYQYNRRFRKYYKENGIRVWDSPDVNELLKKAEKQITSNDIFHVHFVNPCMLKILQKPYMKCQKRILTYWGSDLLRTSFIERYSALPYIYNADIITVINDVMYQKLRKMVVRRKQRCIKCLDFGNSFFNMIDEVSNQMSVEECKAYWGLEPEKIIVSVGYNAIKEQQHLEMMQEVVKLPKKVLQKLFFVFHFGYGKKENLYIKQLNMTLQKNHIQYKIIEQFLDKKEIAILRLSTDIFLYGQTTDALSASVMEYLYAGAVLIKPKWIDYSELSDMGISYSEYKSFQEIPHLLIDLIRHGINRTMKNRGVLKRTKSWEALSSEWEALYKENSNVK
jgi:hypothetical protein